MPKPAKNLELSNIILAQKESQLKDQLDTRMSVKRIPVIGRDLFWPASFFTWLHGLLNLPKMHFPRANDQKILIFIPLHNRHETIKL